MVALNAPRGGWRRKYGGIEWRVALQGVETRADGVMRTKGDPITMERLLEVWGQKIRTVSIVTAVPLPILMMTVATEGALRWKGDHFTFPAFRKEPKYTSDEATPHQISFGPTHVLLSTYRRVMYTPNSGREDAMILMNNLLAAAFYIQNTREDHGWDPILIAATYNAGSVRDASDPSSRFHSRWHIRAYGNHLDRAARWYGDALAVLAKHPAQLLVTPPGGDA